MTCYRKQLGQAMTETLITASTVLVPLLLLIPLLGKYIDIKHAAIQAARYEAWEYTVWYGDNSVRNDPQSGADRPAGFQGLNGSDLPQPVKSVEAVQQESRRRFFSATTTSIGPNDLQGWVDQATNTNDPEETNTLWVDHRGNRLWSGAIAGNTLPINSEATPNHTRTHLEAIWDMLDAAFDALSSGFRLPRRDVEFTAINAKGLAKSNVKIPVHAPVGLIDFATITDAPGVDNSTSAYNFEFAAGAAVLSDSWNSGGTLQTISQVNGITPAKIMGTLMDDVLNSAPGMKTAWNVATSIAPEWRPCNPQWWNPMDPEGDGSLWLGYVNHDLVPPDRLSVGGSKQCPDGICNFSYQTHAPCN